MQTVSPALFSVGTDERDLRPRIGPYHFVALALHKSDEVLLAPALFHGLPDVVHQLELPALALLRRTPFPRGQLGAAALIRLQHAHAVGHAHTWSLTMRSSFSVLGDCRSFSPVSKLTELSTK